jgi:prolyl oligopeptidase
VDYAVTRDGSLLAYAVSAAGSDWMTWRVREVDGQDRPDVVEWGKFSGAAWAPDGSGFFYGRYPTPSPGAELIDVNRGHYLCFHRLGTTQDEDVVVYARANEPDWGFDPHVTEDGRWLLIWIGEGTDPRNRVHLADLADFDAAHPERLEIVPLLDDFDAGYDPIGNIGTRLYFRTDNDAPRGRVIALDVGDPTVTEIVGESQATLERGALFGGRLICVYLDDAKHRLWRFTLDGEDEGPLALPGIGTVGELTGKPEDTVFHFTFTTFTAPVAVCRHDLLTGETRYATEPGLVVDESAFETEQIFVTSTDGAKIPMFCVRPAGLETGTPLPTLLYGYGGFDIAITPGFSVWWLAWLELGGQLAVANLRGGGEYGEEWHQAGCGPHKQQVFDDFIACAEHLVERGHPVAINGVSNGGLLVGACMTQRPELFAACVPEVGTLDMLRYHRFTIGWAWVNEYGSADDAEEFKTLYAYSPLHNLWPRTAYPATLITTGDHDDRVVPGHSFKFAAALQAAQAGDAPALIRITTEAGHGAGKPTHVSIEERADVLAFLVRALEL